jgi:cardiolipin synthase A/B
VILQAIASARRDIRLVICDLSDPIIGQALIQAEQRGVDVRIIVDRNDYATNPDERELLATLSAQGIQVHTSNPLFHQSFEKAFVIDQRTVLIMTMCLTPETFTDTRDDGLVLARRDIINEVTRVFEVDWASSSIPSVTPNTAAPTPPLRVSDLLWSPINSRAKLAGLIQKAHHSIDATTELLDDPFLESDLIAAARRGVQVRLLVPLSQRDTPNVNEPSISWLLSQGIDVHVTNGPAPSPTNPYMHAKTMVVDGRLAYLGSVDLQASSTSDDRELGVLFHFPRIVAQLRAQFRHDWANSQSPPIPVVSGPSEVSGQVGTPLSAQVTARNDWQANIITMTVSDASLPPGLNFTFDTATNQGTLAGTPTASGSYTVPITITNDVNQTTFVVRVAVQ